MKRRLGYFILLAGIFLSACSTAGRSDDSRATTISPSAAKINAAAEQAAEDDGIGAPTEAPESTVGDSNDPQAVDELRTNPRVEVPDNLRVNWLLPPDGIRPVYNPEFVPAAEAPLDDEELVIGVSLEDEAKAYPITVLRFREMVNDELAGWPILVTW
jgi:hypothetical protein